jgi:hypothetical protein
MSAGLSRTPPVECIVEQSAYPFALDWLGIWIGACYCKVRSVLDPVYRHAN